MAKTAPEPVRILNLKAIQIDSTSKTIKMHRSPEGSVDRSDLRTAGWIARITGYDAASPTSRSGVASNQHGSRWLRTFVIGQRDVECVEAMPSEATLYECRGLYRGDSAYQHGKHDGSFSAFLLITPPVDGETHASVERMTPAEAKAWWLEHHAQPVAAKA